MGGNLEAVGGQRRFINR